MVKEPYDSLKKGRGRWDWNEIAGILGTKEVLRWGESQNRGVQFSKAGDRYIKDNYLGKERKNKVDP